MEATASIHFSHLQTFVPSSFLSPPSKLPQSYKLFASFQNLKFSISGPFLPLKTLLYPSIAPSARPVYKLRSSAEEVAVLENPNETQDGNQKRKLFVVNLPWSLSVDDVKNAFSECGKVRDVEFIKNKDGKNRGYAFVTMATGVEAQAVIDKFHSKELSGRTIGVAYAKRLRKPRPQPPVAVAVRETRHKLYVSNLQWKTRSSHLREFFSANFNPVSARVVFENSSGRSAGYGFVSFETREEAEAVISTLNGKELMGRPVSLKFSERNIDTGEIEEERDGLGESATSVDEKDVPGDQTENS